MTHQYELLEECVTQANARIVELQGQIANTETVLRGMNLPEAEITRIVEGLKECSGYNAKQQEVARLLAEQATC